MHSVNKLRLSAGTSVDESTSDDAQDSQPTSCSSSDQHDDAHDDDAARDNHVANHADSSEDQGHNANVNQPSLQKRTKQQQQGLPLRTQPATANVTKKSAAKRQQPQQQGAHHSLVLHTRIPDDRIPGSNDHAEQVDESDSDLVAADDNDAAIDGSGDDADDDDAEHIEHQELDVEEIIRYSA